MVSEICSSAAQRLRDQGSGFRKLVWIHSAAPVVVSAVLLLLTLISGLIAPEGGLSNMETHTMITTVLTLLQIAATVAALFWDAGLNYIVLGFLRGREIKTASLTKGFSKVRPILGSWIFRWCNYMLLMMVSGTVSSLLMSFVPVSDDMYQQVLAFTTNPVFPLHESVLTLACIYFAIYLAVLGVILMPAVYRHRLTAYCIMEDQPVRGLRAVMQSTMLMRGSRRELLKLDLRFWWFYLGEIVVLALSLGQLYISDVAVGSWLFPLLALGVQLALYLVAKPKLALCYGLFYENLIQSRAEAVPEQSI